MGVKKEILTAPASIEAEKSVLGAILLDKDAYFKIADRLDPQDFYHDHHRFVYETLEFLAKNNQPYHDVLAVSERLKKVGKLDVIGGVDFLAELQNSVPVVTHVRDYANVVKHYSVLRKMIAAGQTITGLGYDLEKPLEDAIKEAEDALFQIASDAKEEGFTNISEVAKNRYEELSEIYENKDLIGKGRIKTGFQGLDRILNGGFNKSDLIILAARPGMGKTALALDFAVSAALRQRKKVGIISLEMTKEQLVDRIFCALLEINSKSLHQFDLNKDDFLKMGPMLDELSETHIFLDDSMVSNIHELRTKVMRLKMEKGLDMLVIDYLQLMSGRNPMNRVQEVSEISRGLKEIGRKLDIPIIALSQLSRNVESRENKRPQLSDLRDSGSIEQDADAVLMLYRDDYYTRSDSDIPGQVEINIIKHRHGETGKVVLHFDYWKTKYSDKSEDIIGGGGVGRANRALESAGDSF